MHFRLLSILFVFVFNSFVAQNFVVSQLSMPKCFGDCDGTVTFSTSAVTGPFTAILTNSSSCPNSTVQTSNLNSITINSLCGCASAYSVAIYNPSLILVGTMIQNIVNYATGPLVVNVHTVTPTTCTNCCDGNITFSVSGGNLTNPPTFSINGTYTNNVAPLYFLCSGQHTICVEDASGCIACKNFIMPYFGMPNGINEYELNEDFHVFPNPGNGNLRIQSNHEISQINVFDVYGKLINSIKNNSASTIIPLNLSEYEDGVYHLLIIGPNHETKHQIYLKK
ncbi:MAG: T9SS type A sorting domain-containing protein [Sphingobacteriaceae bacterium]|nr:T9SS type A sorting domain-containing protein [Sphingobacteriaceae bacterium]